MILKDSAVRKLEMTEAMTLIKEIVFHNTSLFERLSQFEKLTVDGYVLRKKLAEISAKLIEESWKHD